MGADSCRWALTLFRRAPYGEQDLGVFRGAYAQQINYHGAAALLATPTHEAERDTRWRPWFTRPYLPPLAEPEQVQLPRRPDLCNVDAGTCLYWLSSMQFDTDWGCLLTPWLRVLLQVDLPDRHGAIMGKHLAQGPHRLTSVPDGAEGQSG